MVMMKLGFHVYTLLLLTTLMNRKNSIYSPTQGRRTVCGRTDTVLNGLNKKVSDYDFLHLMVKTNHGEGIAVYATELNVIVDVDVSKTIIINLTIV